MLEINIQPRKQETSKRLANELRMSGVGKGYWMAKVKNLKNNSQPKTDLLKEEVTHFPFLSTEGRKSPTTSLISFLPPIFLSPFNFETEFSPVTIANQVNTM